MKLVLSLGSYVGFAIPAFLPLSIHFSSHAMFCPKTLMVCSPSLSWLTSSDVKPCTEFQYWDDTIGMLQIVKYWLSCSKVADAPPRRQETTDAPSLPAIRCSVAKTVCSKTK